MSTTTIRLTAELKARVARAAKRAGTTAHGFILDAIAEKAAQEERRADFHAGADDRFARIAASGQSMNWDQMRHYLKKRVSGTRAARPRARKAAR